MYAYRANLEKGHSKTPLVLVVLLVRNCFLCYLSNLVQVLSSIFTQKLARTQGQPHTVHKRVGSSHKLKPTDKTSYTFTGLVCDSDDRAQEVCESRGGRPGLPSLISLRFLWT